MEALEEMPGLAVDAAVAFESYARNAFAFILGSGTTIDWRSLIMYRSWLQSENLREVDATARRKARKKSAEEIEKEKRIQAELRRKRFQKAVRSVFKVFTGFAVGLALWIFVRRSARAGRVVRPRNRRE
jgi:hypothetical protein